MRALDNVGAYAGRSPFQLGKPVGAIVGPYRIKSVQYQAIAVVTNKTRAGGGARASASRRPTTRIERTIDEVANTLGLDRLEVRRRNLIRARGVSLSDPERHDLRQRRLPHRHRQGAGARRLRRADRRARPAARATGMLAGIGIAACLEPSGGNSSFEPLLNPKNATTTWMDSCRISVDLRRRDHRHDAHHLGRAGPRDAGRHRGRRGAGGRPRHDPRGARRTRSTRCRATARSAAAWRSCSAARRSMRRRSSRTS